MTCIIQYSDIQWQWQGKIGMQLSPREEGWQRFSLATCRPHIVEWPISSYRVSGKLRITLCGLLKHLALQFHLWFQKQRLEAEPRDARGCHGISARDAIGCAETLISEGNGIRQPHTVACLWQTWLMNMEWSVNIGLFEHALRTWFWTILRRIRWFWWSSFFIVCAKWRCSFLKSDNSVVTTCDNLEFHNGINSLSTAMAVLRSRPDWPLSPGDSDHLAHRCSRMVHLLSRRAFRSLSQSNSPTVQHGFAMFRYGSIVCGDHGPVRKSRKIRLFALSIFKPFGSIWIILKNKMVWIHLKNLKNKDILSYNELQATFEVVFLWLGASVLAATA